MNSNIKSNIKNDISLSNQSNLSIPMSQYSNLKDQIKKVKYPTYAFSEAQPLQKKIQSFKSQVVRKKLEENLKALNSYRKVRGDGNCFFRALAFCYLSSIANPTFQNCFQIINQVNLACCFYESIPKDFKKFYDHKFLFNVLKTSWQPTYDKYLKQSRNIQKKALLKLFDENPYLDFIIILYFRAVCLKSLYRYHKQFQNFIAGGQETSIRTYSQQTQGITINLCSKILNVTIYVYQIRKQQIHSYHYDTSKIRKSSPVQQICLLFNENHYDIIENNQNIAAEKSVLKKKSTFYGEINQKMIDGICIQCNQQGLVYQASGLCLKCHEYSKTSLNEFKKEKFVSGKCVQCKWPRQDISADFGICRRCIQIQSQVEKHRLEQSTKPKLKRCSSCNRLATIDQQTCLCQSCLNRQKQAMNYMQSSKKKQPNRPQISPKKDEESSNVKHSMLKPQIKINQSVIRNVDSQYNNFLCTKCDKMVLDGKVVNGLCSKCGGK